MTMHIVGWTARFLGPSSTTLHFTQSPGVCFWYRSAAARLDSESWSWKAYLMHCRINGVAVMHNDISDAQARMIRSLDREITVVPDQDTAGMALVDRAIELGWAVSMPDWGC
jgi:hypothetical protein